MSSSQGVIRPFDCSIHPVHSSFHHWEQVHRHLRTSDHHIPHTQSYPLESGPLADHWLHAQPPGSTEISKLASRPATGPPTEHRTRAGRLPQCASLQSWAGLDHARSARTRAKATDHHRPGDIGPGAIRIIPTSIRFRESPQRLMVPTPCPKAHEVLG